MTPTPDYTKKAIEKYNAKFDRVIVNLPKGSKERIKELTGKSCNAYISALVLADLERLDNLSEEEKWEIARKEHEKRMYESTKEPESYDPDKKPKRFPDDYTEEELASFSPRQKELLEQLQMMRDRL